MADFKSIETFQRVVTLGSFRAAGERLSTPLTFSARWLASPVAVELVADLAGKIAQSPWLTCRRRRVIEKQLPMPPIPRVSGTAA